jgi:hypothetical protein
MYKSHFSKYKLAELLPLAESLNADYYSVIEILCNTAKKHASRLKNMEPQQTTSQYTLFCIQLLEEIQAFLGPRRQDLLSYMEKLSEKKSTGHDCRTCKNGCALQHDLKLAELKDTHTHLKDILYRLHMVSLPLYSETIYPDAYRVLRNQMALIENSLTELYFLEEAYLIPRIAEAQKNIYASS